MKSIPLILYHDNCPDGFTAAWAAWKHFGDNNAEYVAVSYGQPPPLDTTRGRIVYLLDFCYPRKDLEHLADVARFLYIFDHHETTGKVIATFVRRNVIVEFDVNRSGAGIAWDQFALDKSVLWLSVRPKLISYIEDRDLWRWTLPNSREVSEYVFTFPHTFESWDRLESDLRHHFNMVIEIGCALLNAKTFRVMEMCEQARTIHLGGHAIPVVNASWDFSEVGECLARSNPDAPCGGYYFDRKDGKRQWGLRAVGDFDVAALCEQYGGGGHKAAAGFVSELGWLGDSNK